MGSLKQFYRDKLWPNGNRTIERDLKVLRDILDLDISYLPKQKKYEVQNREWFILEIIAKELSDVILIDALKNGKEMTFSRTKKNTYREKISTLLVAIQTQNLIQISYINPRESDHQQRLIPLHLRESDDRWYLIARPDKQDCEIASYDLSRIRKITRLEGEVFTEEPKFDAFKHFERFIGVGVDKKDPEEVILEFKGHVGRHLLDYPIHFTQHVISDDGEKIQLSLNVVINQDLINILLRHGDQMRILTPQSLREQYVSLLRAIIDNNSSIQ